MDQVAFFIDIAAPLDRVHDAFWRLEDWPAVAPHVKKIEMLYENDAVQVLVMHVETGARSDRFMSVRVRQGNDIFYFQPTPPPALRQHFGWWRLEASNGSTRVASDHSLDIHLERAAQFLRSAGIEAEGDEAVRERFRQVIHHNSEQTMSALKARLESQVGGSHAA
ncbi:MAG: hypothetical protein KDD11_23090 [Acidobacteria bacterium]|nr:hypothetical protein [Acidobacteriota bacterium]